MPSLALIAPLIGGALSAGSSLLAPALGIGAGLGTAALDVPATFFGAAGPAGLGGIIGSAALSGLGDAAAGALSGLGSDLSGALSQSLQLPSDIFGATGGASSVIGGPAAAALGEAVNAVPAVATDLGSGLSGVFGADTGAAAPGAGALASSALAPSVSDLGSGLGSFFGASGSAAPAPGASTLASQLFGSIGPAGGAALGGIPSSVSGALSSIPTGSGLDLGAPGGAPVQSNPVSTGGGGSTTGTMTSAPTDPTAPVNTPAPTTGGPNSSPGILGQVGDFLQKNKGLLQLLTEGGALGASMLMKPSIPSISSSLNSLNPQSAIGQEAAAGTTGANIAAGQQAAAKNVSAAAQPLLTAPVTGQLPPGMQTLITQALQDTQTGIRSMYASRGMSGSSAEEQDLAAAQERAAAATANLLLTTGQTGASYAGLANQTLSSALSAAQLQGTIYSQIAGVQLSEDTQLQQTLSQLAAASAQGAGFNAQTAAAAA